MDAALGMAWASPTSRGARLALVLAVLTQLLEPVLASGFYISDGTWMVILAILAAGGSLFAYTCVVGVGVFVFYCQQPITLRAAMKCQGRSANQDAAQVQADRAWLGSLAKPFAATFAVQFVGRLLTGMDRHFMDGGTWDRSYAGASLQLLGLIATMLIIHAVGCSGCCGRDECRCAAAAPQSSTMSQPDETCKPHNKQKALAVVTLALWASLLASEPRAWLFCVVLGFPSVLNLLSTLHTDEECRCLEMSWVVLGSIHALFMILLVVIVPKEDHNHREQQLFFVLNVVLDTWSIALAGQRAGFFGPDQPNGGELVVVAQVVPPTSLSSEDQPIYAAQVVPTTEAVQIQVPAGALPGATLGIAVRGVNHEITMPPGASAGQVVTVQVPMA